MPYHTPGDINEETRAPDPQPVSPKCRLSSLFRLSPQNIRDIIVKQKKKTFFFYQEAVDFLAELDLPFIKVASLDTNNMHYLKHTAAKNKPLVVSTGKDVTNLMTLTD